MGCSTDDSLAARHREGMVLCPQRAWGCNAEAWSDSELEDALSAPAYAGYLRARMRLLETTRRVKMALILAVSAPDLANTIIDGRKLQATLKGLGWPVEMALDLTVKQVMTMIKKFANAVRRENADCLVAFAGHAIQVNGRNYLYAADSAAKLDLKYPSDDKYEEAAKRVCLPFLDVQAAFENTREGAKVFVLDCCRIGLSTGVDSGVSSQLENSIVIYSTTSGNVADDGVPGKGGAFMGILCEEIKRSGAEGVGVSKVTERSRKRLLQTPNLHQLASDNSTLLDDFFFSSQRWQQVSLNPLSHMAPPIQRAVDFAVGRIEQRE